MGSRTTLPSGFKLSPAGTSLSNLDLVVEIESSLRDEMDFELGHESAASKFLLEFVNKMAATAKLAQMSKSFFAAPSSVKHVKSLLNGSCKCLAVQNARFIATDPQRKPRNTFFVGLGPSSIQNFEAFCLGRRRTRRLPAVKTEICRFLSQGIDKHIGMLQSIWTYCKICLLVWPIQ